MRSPFRLRGSSTSRGASARPQLSKSFQRISRLNAETQRRGATTQRQRVELTGREAAGLARKQKRKYNTTTGSRTVLYFSFVFSCETPSSVSARRVVFHRAFELFVSSC